MIPGQAQQFFEGAAAQSGSDAFKVERSLRFNSPDEAYLNRTPSSVGNRRTWTWSSWVKRGNKDANNPVVFSADTNNGPWTAWQFTQSDGTIQVTTSAGVSPGLYTNSAFRDFSAWYHIVIAMDTTQATAADRVKLYVNNVEQTFSNTNYPSQNFDTKVNGTFAHYIGYTNSQYFDGYLGEIHFIDGQALAPTAFAEYDDNNNWNPKDCKDDLTYGTNGFYLKFADNSSSAALGTDSSGNGNTWTVNNIDVAGNGLSTANEGFDCVTYTGTGSTQSITGLNFQPDLVWTAVRDQTGYNKYLQDVVRGSTKVVISNSAGAESTQSTAITSFDSGGFTVGSNAQVNESGRSMIAWCWKAGGSPSSNSDGSITTSVSVNTTYGFSIVSYVGNATAGATIGHGLGAVPKFVIIKSRDSGHDWIVYHSTIGNTAALRLNGTNMSDTNTKWFNDAGPSSSTFTLGYTGGTNESGDNMIAYCWSEISGFSKFGGFTHSGSSSSVTGLGFTPRFVLIKRYSATDSWYIFDSARNTNDVLFPNNNLAENAGWAVTFNVDGFSWVGGSFNTGDHMYAAFAAKPDDSVIDSLIDTPSNYEAGSGNNGGNYATYNPLDLHNTADTVSDGNLKLTSSGSGSSHMGRGTIAMKSGKWYFEVTWVDTQHNFVGIVGQNDKSYNNSYTYLSNAKKSNNNGSSEGSSYGETWGNGDIIGVAFDADNGTLAFYKNGVSQGTAFTGIATDGSAGTYSPYPRGYVAITGNWNYNACTSHINFGQRPFAISSVPAGFKALCTQNLADPTVADGSTAMDVALWTANGSNQTITGFNFSPDFVWAKCRNTGTTPHLLADVVRGASKILYSHSTDAEQDYSGIGGVISSFNSDGFDTGSNSDIATNSRTFVGWAWDGGTSTVSNTDGSITSTVRASQTAGMSIVTYTGSANGTVGHGLNAAPEFIIAKSRTVVKSWVCYHKALGKDQYVLLNSPNAAQTSSGVWGSSEPTSSVFGLENSSTGGNTDGNLVAYCFAPVEGFSAFGSYTGNGSSDGPFVYTGFRPSWIMHKRTDTGGANVGDWRIWDVKRDIDNAAEEILFPNTSGAGSSNAAHAVDILSNGFKFRTSDSNINPSGGTIIYAAFAEHPLKTARAR